MIIDSAGESTLSPAAKSTGKRCRHAWSFAGGTCRRHHARTGADLGTQNAERCLHCGKVRTVDSRTGRPIRR